MEVSLFFKLFFFLTYIFCSKLELYYEGLHLMFNCLLCLLEKEQQEAIEHIDEVQNEIDR